MLFNSFHFLVFFTAVTGLYFLLPQKYRWPLLLGSSCYFYMVFIPVYILILVFTIVVDYWAGILLEKTSGKRKRVFLIASLAANIGVLAVFKYYNFLTDNLSALLNGLGYPNTVPHLSILLPVGLSFHTFQAMSYTIEVYRGNQKAERHFGIYALYVMFYPQLVAGPIERPQNLIRQFRENHLFDAERVVDGLRLMAWGLFKKAVIADRLAPVVDTVYRNPQGFSGVELAIATICFSFQIFCDFSGYSDMAVGAARVMGFRLRRNFDRPYLSQSISEFWKRWHISLSTWFRDYLYIPLGGNRVAVPRWYFNLLFVFLVSGLWHGADWTFVAWGGLHGLYLVSAIVTRGLRASAARVTGFGRLPGLHKALKTFITFMLVTAAWIFFRAGNLPDALYICGHLASGWGGLLQGLAGGRFPDILDGISRVDLAVAVAAIAVMETVHRLQDRFSVKGLFERLPRPLQWAAYYAFIFILLVFGVFENRQFIYFQF